MKNEIKVLASLNDVDLIEDYFDEASHIRGIVLPLVDGSKPECLEVLVSARAYDENEVCYEFEDKMGGEEAVKFFKKLAESEMFLGVEVDTGWDSFFADIVQDGKRAEIQAYEDDRDYKNAVMGWSN